MSGTRIQIDLFFKDKTPKQVNDAFPELRPIIKAAKLKASIINEGKPNEERTTKAVYYICHHDETPHRPCEPEVEI